jgi:hypothetical protein
VNFSISPQIRIVALVGLVLVVGAGGASMMLGRSGNSNPSASAPPLHRHARPTQETLKAGSGKTAVTPKATGKVLPLPPAASKAAAAAKALPGAKTATKTTVVHTKHHTTVVRRGNLVYSDLPAPLQWQLAKHHIVVVSIYNPNSDVDAISVAEAHAGATEAGAGFLLVSVLDNSVAGPLTALLPGGGLLPDPGILIYRSPGNMAMRIDGFVDRDAVAQAASNAFAGQNSPLTSTDSSSSSSGSYGATP